MTEAPGTGPARGDGRRVLVIDDEAMIRMLLENMLEELGHVVVAEAGRIEEALSLAQSCECDLAILDVNLNGASIAPVADALLARGVPYVFATGYQAPPLPEIHRGRPILHKPFEFEELGQAVKSVLAHRA
jgi:CheY-like chemotaxis protein